MRRLLLIIAILLLPSAAAAAKLHLEAEYQTVWCEKMKGVQEYVLDDGARVDCLTDKFAVEFDFGPKWAEGIGQALYYAIKTGKEPLVVLILEEPGDQYLARLKAVAKKYGITVWTMAPGDL
jgi:hypothetical protein